MAGLAAHGRWVDLGSGAGFPGVALAALYPEAEVWMVESRQKRATFLEQVVAQARLTNARVRCQRSEELPASSFDGVVSRAYKPPQDFLVDAARLLRPGGRAVLMLGDRDPPPPPPGWAEESHRRYAVPDGSRLRQILTCLPDRACQ
jgi:16S rRNA (guanine527-N7)-methyltransferase